MSAQQSVFTTPVVKSKIVSNSFENFSLANNASIGWEFLKHVFLIGAYSRDLPTNVKLYHQCKIYRYLTTSSEKVQQHFKSDLEICVRISIQFDNSVDITDTSQLAGLVRILFNNFSVKELLKILQMTRRIVGENIYKLL